MPRKLFQYSLLTAISLSSASMTYGDKMDPKALEAHNKYDLTMDEEVFKTTLFAAPPNVEYVTAVSADTDGTVYVSVDQNGSLGHVKGYGKVVTAKDTDGDGKADVFKDFIPNVESPRGGHIVAGTYYLLHPPYLTMFKDTDGDGVFNDRKTLVTGFGGGIEHPRGADHTTNGVRMGIDGWLYVSVGDFGMSDAKGTDGKVVRLFGGGVARVRPDGSELEVYVYNTRNQFDVAISPTLDLFTRDNTNDGKGWNLRVHHQIPESDFGYPRLYQNFPDEHLTSLADYGGGSGMGCLYLSEPGFPESMNNQLFTCDWTSGKVFGFNMKENEGSYSVEQTVLSNLNRASDIDVDGSSRLYLADWKGGRFSYGGGIPVSRIHMSQLKGYKAPAVPDFSKLNDQKLVESLAGPSATIRLQAQQHLLLKGLTKGSIKLLGELASNKSEDILVRIAALFTLKQGQGEASHKLCLQLLDDPAMRTYALKALTDRKSQLSNVSADVIGKYLNDSDPKVRLQAAISLRRLNKYTEGSVNELIKMATSSWKEDSVGNLGTAALPHIASRALAGLGQSHKAVWKQYLNVFTKSDYKTQKALSYGLKTIHSLDLIDALISEFASDNYKDENRMVVLEILARLSHKEKEWDLKYWWGTRPHDEGPYFESIEWEGTARIIKAIEKNFQKFSNESQLKVLDVVALNQINPSSLKLEGVDTLFFAFEASEPTKQHINVLKGTAMDESRPWNIRVKAGKKLSEFHNWIDPGAIVIKKNKKKKTQKKIVNKEKLNNSIEMRKTATKVFLEVLSQWQTKLKEGKVSRTDSKLVSALIHDYWTAPVVMKDDLPELVNIANKVNDEAATLAWKKILFSFYRTLGERVVTAEKLIDSEESLHNAGYYKAISEMYLLDEKFLKRAKSVLTWDYKGVREGSAAVVAMHEAKAALQKDSIKSEGVVASGGTDKALKYAMENKGDIELGKKLFDRQGCIACHAVNNAGIQKGPYMGTAGSQFERKFLIESVLNPAAAIAQGFPTYMITPKSGRGNPAMGFLVDQDNTNYYLMNMAGLHQSLTKEHMASKKIIPTSQMPPGLVFNLNMHEFNSLIEYLVSMK